MSATEQQQAPSTAIERKPDRTPLTQRDPVQLATMFFQSGYFSDVKSAAQAVVKMAAGEELGLGPMASMQGIHIIEGKPSLSANLLGVQVKRSEHYNFRPRTVTDKKAEVAFFEDGEEIGVSEFTIEQAERAGLVKPKSGWVKFPEAMLFARALSQGVRWYCPDVTAGSPAYTPEELGAEVDEQGEPLHVQAVVEPTTPANALSQERVEHLAKGIEVAGLNYEDLNVHLGSLGIDGFDPTQPIPGQLEKLTEEQADALNAELQKLVEGEEADAGVVEEGGEDADA